MSAFTKLGERLEQIAAERVARVEQAVQDHRDWVRSDWSSLRHDFTSDGESLGWKPYGDEDKSRERLDEVIEGWRPRQQADLRERVSRALEAT